MIDHPKSIMADYISIYHRPSGKRIDIRIHDEYVDSVRKQLEDFCNSSANSKDSEFKVWVYGISKSTNLNNKP